MVWISGEERYRMMEDIRVEAIRKRACGEERGKDGEEGWPRLDGPQKLSRERELALREKDLEVLLRRRGACGTGLWIFKALNRHGGRLLD